MDGLELLLVLLAGVLAGTINTVVGAGTLVTFPLLVWLGIPPLTANVSNTVGLVPASVTGAWGYRRELAGAWGVVARMAVLSAIGGVAGGLLLLVAPAESFTAVVPWLLVVAAVLAAAQPRVSAVVRRRAAAREERLAARRDLSGETAAGTTSELGTTEAGTAEAGTAEVGTAAARATAAGRVGGTTLPLTLGLGVGVAATGVYGGYFGAAQGVVLLALLGIGWTTDMHRANGAKNVLAGVANLVSATVFVVGGVVDWRIAGLVAVGSALGGVIGARVGRRLPAPLLRGLIVVVALTAAVVLWSGG
ncbi:sulfite exporter TauE/SafE family protein [Actinotalea ferrariae]|uniref:sulfite exporter TauE/SafE family protein n=1 Tax=Actinotalea ferrariae TaxID=1386098 RepID=UPI001C8BBD3C|nr:sulfite exporter TauE/SafE family protein [Actinotalea ferrariae]MBX9244428.1 sulfite exporter TauE/SafE family protein [Actinotalea ferrariae]